MRVSRLRRWTCTASAFLQTVSSDCMSSLEIWIYWFWNEVFEEKKKNRGALTRSQSLMLRWKILCAFKNSLPGTLPNFLDFCFLDLKCRTNKINLLTCVLQAKCSPKISFLLLIGIWVALVTSASCNYLITYVILSNLGPNLTHIHSSLSINIIKKLSYNLFAELFNLQTL